MEHQKDNRSDSSRTNGQNDKGLAKDQAFQGYGFIMRKTEKLTTALYLVTDILSDKEPMKWRARETGVDVLSDVTVAATAGASEKMSTLRVVLKKIERVVSYLDIASSTRMISDMNASVLKKEYLALRDNIEAEWSRTHERSRSLLNERFFEVREDSPRELADGERKQLERDVQNRQIVRDVFSAQLPQVQSIHKNDQKNDQQYDQQNEERSGIAKSDAPVARLESPASLPPVVDTTKATKVTETPATSYVARTVMGVPVTPAPARYQPPRPAMRVLSDTDVIARSRPDVTKDDRRKIILALIKQKPAITVGDIAKSIPAVSEKTIQRELLSMVSENVLVKRGERRWSTYSLREG